MTTYYKATRPDGGSFHDPSVKWVVGGTVTHPSAGPMVAGDASTYLSVSVEPTDCTGMEWPCRLFQVEPVGEVIADGGLPNKRCAKAWHVVGELDATLALGPQGVHVVALIEHAGRLAAGEVDGLYAAGNAAWDAAWDAALNAVQFAARSAAWNAARDAAWDAAWYAARYAAWAAAGYTALALLVRDLISTEDYDTLTMPWRTTVGRLHPDDKDVAA